MSAPSGAGSSKKSAKPKSKRNRYAPCAKGTYRHPVSKRCRKSKAKLELSGRQCSQCIATATNGARCRRRTCKSKLCHTHLERDAGLRIAPSTIPNAGWGLFTTVERNTPEPLGIYAGEITTKGDIDQTYGNGPAPYAVCHGVHSNSMCVDAKLSNDSAVRYANTESRDNTGLRNNVTLVFNEKQKRFEMIPSGQTRKNKKDRRKIKKGQEIIASYRSRGTLSS